MLCKCCNMKSKIIYTTTGPLPYKFKVDDFKKFLESLEKKERKMTNKFKIGDTVIANEKADKYEAYTITRKGWIGRVIKNFSWNNENFIRVKQDGANGYGFSVNPDCFDLYIPHEGKILIMVDEKDPNKIVARDLITKKTAEAKCNPKDEWGFAKGAKLALERLYPEKKEEEKPKYWSGKVVCVESTNNKYFMVGKVYAVKNGELFNNFQSLPCMYYIKDFEDIAKHSALFKFIEFKGEASHA